MMVKIDDSCIHGHKCGKGVILIDGVTRTFTDVHYLSRMFVSFLSVLKLDEDGVRTE